MLQLVRELALHRLLLKIPLKQTKLHQFSIFKRCGTKTIGKELAVFGKMELPIFRLKLQIQNVAVSKRTANEKNNLNKDLDNLNNLEKNNDLLKRFDIEDMGDEEATKSMIACFVSRKQSCLYRPLANLMFFKVTRLPVDCGCLSRFVLIKMVNKEEGRESMYSSSRRERKLRRNMWGRKVFWSYTYYGDILLKNDDFLNILLTRLLSHILHMLYSPVTYLDLANSELDMHVFFILSCNYVVYIVPTYYYSIVCSVVLCKTTKSPQSIGSIKTSNQDHIIRIREVIKSDKLRNLIARSLTAEFYVLVENFKVPDHIYNVEIREIRNNAKVCTFGLSLKFVSRSFTAPFRNKEAMSSFNAGTTNGLSIKEKKQTKVEKL
ncbi:hypothetical protein WN51_06654 [Melipona quadrifasciata]|uniref:Uncharacterized protein n=1 Tax=Melipona quadrifasciata TaxID=166423 RepID=A0A0M9AA57_9HYME|nr:hypothetical protein WN51_06654 [Melipona quadrifasciata]